MNTDFIPLSARPDGSIPPRELRKLGGALSFTQSLRNGGAGSPRVIYNSGLQAFTSLSRNLVSESAFLSLEEVNDGLVLRCNCGNRLAARGLAFERIERIELLAHRIYTIYRSGTNQRYGHLQKTVYHGELAILTVSGDIIRATVPTREFRSVSKFLRRDSFSPYFLETISQRTPEIEFTRVFSHLGPEVELT
ncbi:hypothetical protein [Lewinella sp. 4G2]|uniref:hypothetical protein n=1 Tax=Lewinella sp. 4G2 TaxID=1803372 RepID=UPI0007B4E401|nr:hypothetical protein [Lewinella sp. 4G2]OAV44705.1 hypothetical protein A3850_009470 [Lewinella sp. 4G2]